jgi:hypothetical protein
MSENIKTSAIMSAGMSLLREGLGEIDTEIFIMTVKRDRFDYTEWRRDNLFPGMSIEEIIDHAAEYEHTHGVPQIRKL